MGPSQSGRITAEPSSGVVNSIGSDPALALPIRNEPFVAGEVIAEKYKVERVIGVGGVAIVVAARHIDLDELVAIKVLQPEVQAKRDLVARFAREAKAAVKIKSEYAARILDVGVSPGRGPYLIMEYLEGQDLGAQLVASGPLPYKRAVEYVMQACEALAVAHANGIVHRDIKPENLFLAKRADGSEAVKVLDFGISKAALTGTLFGVGENMVQTQELMGTPLYMSPEQIRSTASVDRRSDIWSLGVVLYELVTGHLAFSGEAITKICADVLEKEPAPLSKYIPDLPDGLQQVVTRCLAKDPDKRFQNVGELALALLPFGPSKGRILAERSSAIMNSGGPNEPVVMKFSSSPPPTSASVRSSASPGTIPSSGRVPTMPASGSQVPTGAAGAPAPAVAAPGPPKQAIVVGRKQGKTILSLAGVAVFLLMGLAAVGTFILVGSSKATSPVASASTVPAAPSLRPLTITTDPPGARVEWEGKLLGETPVTTTFPIGVNTLKLTHDGYTPETISVTVAAADAPDRKASLTMTKIGDKPPVGGPALTVTGGGPVARPSFLPSRQPGMGGSGRGFAANGSKSSAAPAAPPPAATPVSPIDTSSTGTTSVAAKTVQPPAAPPPKVKLIGEKKTNVVVVE